MIVCVALSADGSVGQGWGRAGRVAVAEIGPQGIGSWQEIQTDWDRLHDASTEGSHHARIARFLAEHRVEMVIAGHMGPGMQQMLGRMGIAIRLGAEGDPRQAVLGEAGAEGAPAPRLN